MLHFPLISRKLQYFMYLVLWHRFAPNLIGKILIIKKYVHSIFMHIYWQVAVLLACLFSSKYTRRKKTGLAKIFDFRFLMHLHILWCSEQDLTIFRKWSVCLFVWCISPKFCGHCFSRTNARKLMKLYIQYLDTIWCWLDFGAYRSRSKDVVLNSWFGLCPIPFLV